MFCQNIKLHFLLNSHLLLYLQMVLLESSHADFISYLPCPVACALLAQRHNRLQRLCLLETCCVLIVGLLIKISLRQPTFHQCWYRTSASFRHLTDRLQAGLLWLSCLHSSAKVQESSGRTFDKEETLVMVIIPSMGGAYLGIAGTRPSFVCICYFQELRKVKLLMSLA